MYIFFVYKEIAAMKIKIYRYIIYFNTNEYIIPNIKKLHIYLSESVQSSSSLSERLFTTLNFLLPSTSTTSLEENSTTISRRRLCLLRGFNTTFSDHSFPGNNGCL